MSDFSEMQEEHEAGVGELERMAPIPRIAVQAFCETGEVAEPIEKAGGDRRMAKAALKVHMGGFKAALDHFKSAPTPNLVILETKLGPVDLLNALEELADVCDPGSKVAVVGHYNDVSLYRELIRRGVSEYMVAPIALADILAVISNLFAAPDAEPLGQSIAFVGAKGGVGSSTIAHNTAWSISRLFSTDVMVADLDLPFGTANINFDRDPPQGIAEAIFSPERMDDVFLDRLLSECSDHLSLLAAPSTLDKAYDFDRNAFAALIETAQKGTPFVVLDVPHVWNDWTRQVLTHADQIVVTASPDLANLRNAKNLVDTLAQLRPNDGKPHLILNQMGIPKRPEIAADEFCEPLGIKPIAEIAFDPETFGNAANSGQMLSETGSKSPAIAAFEDVAHILTGRNQNRKAKKKAGLFDRLLGKAA